MYPRYLKKKGRLKFSVQVNFFPTPSTWQEEKWKKCIIAIDKYLKRKKKEAKGRQDTLLNAM